MRTRGKAAAAAIAATLAAAALLASCSFATHSPLAENARPPSPAVVSPSIVGTPSPSPSTGTESLLGPGDHGVVPRGSRLDIWRRPSSARPKENMKMINPLGQTITMLVTDAAKAGGKTWYEVLLPERPNGSKGWVKAGDVSLVKLHDRIEIDLSKYRLDYFHDNKLADSFKVGIGRNIWPTPTGTFYVWARVPQASPLGPYGAYAMGLSGFSPVLSEWPGGGRVAIHGTANPADPGHKVSHGCIRVFNKDVVRLRHVPMGTPVVIQK